MYTRTFLTRGPSKCHCDKESKHSLEDRVRQKANELNSEITHVDKHWQGRVEGHCHTCQKAFDVCTRSFLSRGPTKCLCPPRKASTFDETNPVEADTEEPDDEEPPKRPTFPPPTMFAFPVRGNSFRSEGLGLIGAKRLLIERGNLEQKQQLHFLCDNKANIDLHQQMQKNIAIPPRHFIFKDNQLLERELLKKWKEVKYIFVKGHVGIPQNEACDERAKKEVARCTEKIAMEGIDAFGDVRKEGMRVETRRELSVHRRWMSAFATELMKCCRTRMAKRVQLGIEKWRGNISVFLENKPMDKCSRCHLAHGLKFSEMVLECPQCAAFRKEVKERWKMVLGTEKFEQELLFGKIRRSLLQKVGQGKDEKRVWREMTLNLRWWERRLQLLRKELGDSAIGNEGNTSEMDEDGETSPMADLAKEIRVLDEGIIKGGEPDIFFPDDNKDSLKKFLGRRKREK